jgi:hypothetical protein
MTEGWQFGRDAITVPVRFAEAFRFIRSGTSL